MLRDKGAATKTIKNKYGQPTAVPILARADLKTINQPTWRRAKGT